MNAQCSIHNSQFTIHNAQFIIQPPLIIIHYSLLIPSLCILHFHYILTPVTWLVHIVAEVFLQVEFHIV